MRPSGLVAKINEPVRLISGDEWSIDLRRVLKSVQREIVLAISDPLRRECQNSATDLLIRDMLATGKRVRILVSPKYADSRSEHILHAEGALADCIRVSYSDFRNAMIIDGREGVVWSCADGAARAYLFNGEALPGSIRKTITRSWSAGLPLRDHVDLRRKNFDSVAIAVIRTLNAGASDVAAARMLSVSPRTYRRHVANIMHRLDITTRFQLGARAAELGLLHIESERRPPHIHLSLCDSGAEIPGMDDLGP